MGVSASDSVLEALGIPPVPGVSSSKSWATSRSSTFMHLSQMERPKSLSWDWHCPSDCEISSILYKTG